MSRFYEKGLRFSCTGCGYCCSKEPGYVFLTDEDLRGMLACTCMGREEFISAYCRLVDMGTFRLVSLKEKTNNDCIFFEDSRCSVYEFRPLQCRSYPFWNHVLESSETWAEEAQRCPGIGGAQLHSAEEIEHWLYRRRTEKPIEL
jgi:uncharacterized protein